VLGLRVTMLYMVILRLHFVRSLWVSSGEPRLPYSLRQPPSLTQLEFNVQELRTTEYLFLFLERVR